MSWDYKDSRGKMHNSSYSRDEADRKYAEEEKQHRRDLRAAAARAAAAAQEQNKLLAEQNRLLMMSPEERQKERELKEFRGWFAAEQARKREEAAMKIRALEESPEWLEAEISDLEASLKETDEKSGSFVLGSILRAIKLLPLRRAISEKRQKLKESLEGRYATNWATWMARPRDYATLRAMNEVQLETEFSKNDVEFRIETQKWRQSQENFVQERKTSIRETYARQRQTLKKALEEQCQEQQKAESGHRLSANLIRQSEILALLNQIEERKMQAEAQLQEQVDERQKQFDKRESQVKERKALILLLANTRD